MVALAVAIAFSLPIIATQSAQAQSFQRDLSLYRT